jgi:UDP-N-acetylmuramoyl-L-alanyl-D-glutamate--2,6-diaminopimelate ligase
MTLGDLIAGLDLRFLRGAPLAARSLDITGISEDSRTVKPGELFVARAGLKADGRRYVLDAARAGAAAVLLQHRLGDDPPEILAGLDAEIPVLASPDVAAATAVLAERLCGNPASSLFVVGVTGTNGKTTTTWLTWQLLNAAGVPAGLVGTVWIDDGTGLRAASMTTPPAIEMSRVAASLRDHARRAMILEASSHALDQKRVDALGFRIGVFTNLTGDHLDYHKTMESYAAAKARLFSMLPADGTAIVNADDRAAASMVKSCRAPVLACTVGTEPKSISAPAGSAPCRARILSTSMRGMHLELHGPWGLLDARVPLVGRHNAMNLLQAVASAHALGLSRDVIASGLQGVTAPSGRLEPVAGPDDDLTVLVDYAHTDDALRNALSAVREAMNADQAHTGRASGKLWALFGAGGNKDRTKRPRMGKVAAELADVVLITSDNPRTEVPEAIIEEILAGVPQDRREITSADADRARAIASAIRRAAPGDVLVIAGKGHEKEQILPDGRGGTRTIPFDDCDVARRALAERRRAATRAAS